MERNQAETVENRDLNCGIISARSSRLIRRCVSSKGITKGSRKNSLHKPIQLIANFKHWGFGSKKSALQRGRNWSEIRFDSSHFPCKAKE